MSEIELNKDVNVEEEYSDKLLNDVKSRVSSILFKRIGNITISDQRLQNAFKSFVKDIECGSTISVADVLFASETVLKGGTVSEKANDDIYCIKNVPLDGFAVYYKVLKNSVAGLLALLNLHSGAIIDLNALGKSIASADTMRYIVMPEKKAKKLIEFYKLENIEIKKVGRLISENKIYLSRGENVVGVIDKSKNDESPETLLLKYEHYNDFVLGYNTVCSMYLTNLISDKNVLRFGTDCELASAFARALGCYCAAMMLKFMPIRTTIDVNSNISVAVPKPNVADGDYFYFLKVRSDNQGFPDKVHFAQLVQYLREKKRMGIIKDVLPVRENIQETINKLSGEKLEYVPLNEFPKDCFGVIVSVKRGDSLNGIKLGYFTGN